MRESYIGILADDGPGLYAGILGILKSGNAFVPINPVFPEDRVRFILADCKIKLLLTDASNYEKARRIAQDSPMLEHVLRLDDLSLEETAPIAETKAEAAADKPGVSADCYVIYTSGSTGKPKGVPITHRNLLPLFFWFREYFGLGEHTRVMQNLSYTFDFGVFEILTTLIYGGGMYVPNKQTIGEYSAYVRFIHAHQVNTVHTTPVFFGNLVSYGLPMPTVKLVHLGGEKLSGKTVRNIAQVVPPECIIYNGYGPTEATINCSIFSLNAANGALLDEQADIPIGRPTAYNELYVLDKHDNLQPVGVPGELCVAGAGLAAGYLNRPELTAERFTELNWSDRTYRPYVSESPTEKIYRTGDLVHWLDDGNIRFLGRIDHQVKVRGFRIELGEIENMLLKHPLIQETIVVARVSANGSNYLCAYLVSDSTEPLTVSRLREYLAQELPDYMIPAYFIRLEQMPLNPNGKIDRKALPEPDESSIVTGVEYAAPESETEKRMTRIWEQLLPGGAVGIDDDFFELGGDSILANQCMARIREEFRVEIPLRTFFERPYIRGLSAEVEKHELQSAASIKPMKREGEIPLSFAQERLWFLQQLDEENVAYFVPRVIRMKGQLDVSLLERTFTEIIRRHEILRTVFPTVDGRPVQRVQEAYYFKIPLIDWSKEQEESQSAKIDHFLEEEGQRQFNFETGPLLRVTVVKLSRLEHLLVLTEHHLIHDGWTQGVLLREFIEVYSAYYEGREHMLPELPIQYADFALWQREVLQGEVLAGHLGYWQEKLSGLAPVLDLPADRPRPAVISGEGGLNIFRLSEESTRRLKEFSRTHGVTLYMTMLAVFKTFLYRYTGVEDLCSGTGIANRRYKEMEGMLGMVINTLPLRTQVGGEISFGQCLERVRTTCLEAYQHEDTPFGKIVEVLNPERNSSYMPLFQIMFSFMDTPTEDLRLPGLVLHLEDSHNRSSKFDINIVVVPPPEHGAVGETLVEWEYNTDIFNADTVERMVGHYLRLLEESIADPSKSLSQLPMLSKEEVNRLLYEFNAAQPHYPRDKTIPQLFSEQVQRTPDSIAVVAHLLTHKSVETYATHITYKALDAKTDALAAHLTAGGVTGGDIVAIKTERSLEMILGLLGILKAGAAYLPIDPNNPEERIRYMLNDSSANILLTRQDIAAICTQNADAGTQSAVFPDASRFAYIIYTSGSTGNPKGVPITHANLSPLLHWGYEVLALNSNDRVIQILSFYFDWSVWEIFLTLTGGAALYMIPTDIVMNPEAQIDFVRKHRITLMEMTPTQFTALLASEPNHLALESLKYLCIGAEKLTWDLVKRCKRLIRPGCRIFNMYGPTETTIISTVCEVPVGDEENCAHLLSVPIGKPVANATNLVLDSNRNLCPINVTGELYIGGDGVSMGYLNNPELTAERFVNLDRTYKSYRSYGSYFPEEKLYRTGDRVRWLSSGEIEFFGRFDFQVKIRGLRIELGEIENRLLDYKKVEDAVVIDRAAASGDKYLCAYIVPSDETAFEDAAFIVELKDYLSRQLPAYMIPPYFVLLKSLPLNANGKIDRKALPEPETLDEEHELVAPGDHVEKALAEVWSSILRKEIEKIGVTDNFFDLGGHSLNATLLTARIHKAFNVNIPLKEFFKRGNIREVALYIKEAGKDECVTIPLADQREYYPLTPSQERLYILHQFDHGGIAYNTPAVLRLSGAVDIGRFETAVKKLPERHESLRTSFQIIDKKPFQRIHPAAEIHIEYHDITGDPERETAETKLVKEFVRPFDLTRAPLLRMGLVVTGVSSYLLMVDMHHIITDGVSMEIFIDEIVNLYRGNELPPLRLQYKDYSLWLQGESRQKQAEYWRRQFSPLPPLLELPLDFPRAASVDFAGSRHKFFISKETTEALQKHAFHEGISLQMLMVAVFHVFLAKESGQEDIVTGTTTAGRRHPDLHPIIGLFINTLALRSFPSGEKRFSDFLNEVREMSLEAYENQEYPFEKLVAEIAPSWPKNRSPLFDVMFEIRAGQRLSAGTAAAGIHGLEVRPVETEITTAKFDMDWVGTETFSGIDFTIDYSTRLFRRETVVQMAGHFSALVENLVDNYHTKIKDLDYRTTVEKELTQVEDLVFNI